MRVPRADGATICGVAELNVPTVVPLVTSPRLRFGATVPRKIAFA